jgi:hypothetical protein
VIRRSPAEKYLLYLLSVPDVARTVEDLRDHFLELQLLWLGSAYVDRLKGRMELPQPFYPYERQHRESVRWLLSTGLFDFYHPTDAVEEAKTILSNPRAKEFAEALFITRVPLINIRDGLAKRLNVRISIGGLEKYQYYFFNTDLVDSTEMRALLLYQHDIAKKHPDVEVAAQGKLLERAGYGDGRRLATNMPHSPYTSMIAQMRMGVYPYKLDFAAMLEAIQNAAAIKALEIVQSSTGGMQAALDATSYLNMAVKAAEAAKEIVDPTQALKDQFNAVRLRTAKKDLVVIQQLSNGNHTADIGAPLPIEGQEGDGDVPMPDDFAAPRELPTGVSE